MNAATLALNVVKEVGSQGDFLGHPHTFEHMTTQSRSELIDRRGRGKWEREGSTDMYARGLQKARHILETHEPDPLPDPVVSRIRKIVAETEREMGIAAD